MGTTSYMGTDQSHCTFTFNFNRYDKNLSAVVQASRELSLWWCSARDYIWLTTLPGVWAESALWHLPWLLHCRCLWQPSKDFAATELWLLPSVTSLEFPFWEDCDCQLSNSGFLFMKRNTTFFCFQPAARFLHLVPCSTSYEKCSMPRNQLLGSEEIKI